MHLLRKQEPRAERYLWTHPLLKLWRGLVLQMPTRKASFSVRIAAQLSNRSLQQPTSPRSSGHEMSGGGLPTNPSEILGLAGALSGKPHEAWAETTQPARIGFIKRERFVRAMGCQSELATQVANLLAESYLSVIAGTRMIGLSCSAKQKLAVFLLDWSESNRALNDNDGARFAFTHDEIAQAIGSSRETVTRTLSVFEESRLIRWKASNLVLMDRSALEKISGES
jgi:hypothetical protein